MPPNASHLRNFALFGALNDEAIAFLHRRSEQVRVHEGGTFFEQGTPGDCLYVLLSGSVEVIKSDGRVGLRLAELGPGDFFGELALVAIQCRSATVRAVEDCIALKLRNTAILALHAHDSQQFTLIQMNLGREIARRLHKTDDALFAERCRNLSLMKVGV